MGRGMAVAVGAAVVVGGVVGGVAALVVTRSPAPADARGAVAATMAPVLARFTAWARDHAGEPCPDAAALGARQPWLDPWGHALELTCSAQPADQQFGAISAGPDGIRGTPDDVASWALGPGLADRVRGARWPAASPRPRPALAAPRAISPARRGSDDIPAQR